MIGHRWLAGFVVAWALLLGAPPASARRLTARPGHRAVTAIRTFPAHTIAPSRARLVREVRPAFHSAARFYASRTASPRYVIVAPTPYQRLPQTAKRTIELIKQGGPFPFPQKDGTVYHNRDGQLPAHEPGYYREYTVGGRPGNRGSYRIVTGAGGEYYYSANHYRDFSLVLF